MARPRKTPTESASDSPAAVDAVKSPETPVSTGYFSIGEHIPEPPAVPYEVHFDRITIPDIKVAAEPIPVTPEPAPQPAPISPEVDAREMDRYIRVINNWEQADRISDVISHNRETNLWGVHQFNNSSRNTYSRSFYFKDRVNAVTAVTHAKQLIS